MKMFSTKSMDLYTQDITAKRKFYCLWNCELKPAWPVCPKQQKLVDQQHKKAEYDRLQDEWTLKGTVVNVECVDKPRPTQEEAIRWLMVKTRVLIEAFFK